MRPSSCSRLYSTACLLAFPAVGAHRPALLQAAGAGFGPAVDFSASAPAAVAVLVAVLAGLFIRERSRRLRAEAGRRETDRRYRLLRGQVREMILQIREAILRMGPDGRLDYLNPAWSEITGVEVEQSLGRPLTDFLQPEDRDLFLRRRQEVLDGADEVRLEARCRAPGGARWVELCLRPIREAGGRMVGVGATMADVTGRREAERSLRETDARFRSLVQHGNDLITLIDAGGNIAYESPSVTRILGYAPEELVGGPAFARVHPEDLPRLQAALGSLEAARQEAYTEFRVLSRAGEWRWLEATAKNLLDDPAVRAVVVNSRDVTERKAAREALLQSEERHRIVAEMTGQAIYDYDVPTGRIEWSGAVREIAGYTPDDPRIGTIAAWTECIHPEDRAGALERLDVAMRSGGSFDVRYRFRSADGDYRHIKDRGAFLTDAGGRAFRMLGTLSDVTDRQAAEEALAEEQNLLRTLIHNIPDSLFVKDRQCRFILANEAAARSVGAASAEALTGKSDFDFLPQEFAEHIFADEQMVLMTGEPILNKDELYVAGPIEEARWYSTTKIPLRNRTGEIVGLVGVGRDITQRKRQEAALRESEARFRVAFHNAPIGLMLVSPGGRWLRVNRALCDILGYSEAELLTMDTRALTHPEDETVGLRERRKMVAGVLETYRLDKRFLHKDGHEVWTQLDVSAVRDAKGQVLYQIAQVQDITERRRAEREIQRNQAFLDSIIENIPHAVYVKDAVHLRFVLYNRASQELLGYSREEILGKSEADVLPVEQAAAGMERDWAALAGSGTVDLPEEIAETRHHGRRVLHTKKIPIRDEEGRPLFLLGISEDITERRAAEQALNEARRAAEAADRAKSAFLANMSHEIRTPMNGVIGMTELLLETRLTPEQRESAEIIRSSGDALLALINDILDFSKIEAGQIELEQRPMDVRAAVEGALDMVALLAAEKRLDLVCRIDPTVPPALRCDEVRLRQILLNLLSNAIKFTEEGEICVSVASEPLDAERHRLRFSVQDAGIGIPRDRVNRLFERFSQVDASTTRKYGGTGLGLAISKRLAELMGGTMWVESEVGVGSTFSFYLEAEAAPPDGAGYCLGPQPAVAGRSVLVVDAHAGNRDALAAQLLHWGMAPLPAASASAALALLEEGRRVDLALIDQELPDGEACLLAEELRARAGEPLPVLLLTTFGRAAADRRDRFQAVLTKPVKTARLLEALRAALAGRRAPAAPADAAGAAEKRRFPPMRILLVEDNPVNEKVTRKLLSRLGFEPEVAVDGEKAFAAVRAAVAAGTAYDLVFMDVQMPVMDGVQCTALIREQIPAPLQPRVVGLTANAVVGDRERLLASGMDDYLSKPVKLQEMEEALLRAVASRAGGDGHGLGLPEPGSVGHTSGTAGASGALTGVGTALPHP